MTTAWITVTTVLVYAAYRSGCENSWAPLAGWAGFLAIVYAMASLP